MPSARIGTVYVIYKLPEDIPLYVGSTIRKLCQRKAEHKYDMKRRSTPFIKYLEENPTEYKVISVYRTEYSDRDKAIYSIRRIEQQWILYLRSFSSLLNVINPCPLVSQYKTDYPWMSNKFMLNSIYGVLEPPNNIPFVEPVLNEF